MGEYQIAYLNCKCYCKNHEKERGKSFYTAMKTFIILKNKLVWLFVRLSEPHEVFHRLTGQFSNAVIIIVIKLFSHIRL